ncbi:hypothetical protein J2W42_001375 [Rhizobium tibeticum]|nr:hypothetical protein [Rhizobium tibeticum]
MARMEVSEAKRLKALEDEIARLKKLLAEQMLQPHSASFSKKMVLPAAKRDAVTHLKAVMGLSERQACQIISADRKSIRYRSCRPPGPVTGTMVYQSEAPKKRFSILGAFGLPSANSSFLFASRSVLCGRPSCHTSNTDIVTVRRRAPMLPQVWQT